MCKIILIILWAVLLMSVIMSSLPPDLGITFLPSVIVIAGLWMLVETMFG
jgi:hypothetical protein